LIAVLETTAVDELGIPSDARSAGRAFELVRVYRMDVKLHTVLRIGFWGQISDEHERWARVLSDTVQHVATTLAERDGISVAQGLRRIRTALDEELDEPTTRHSGRYTE
jgi:hypothetical protein